MQVYEECLRATNTPHAPWYVVPADGKESARLIVSRIVLDALEELKMAWPRATPKRRAECSPSESIWQLEDSQPPACRQLRRRPTGEAEWRSVRLAWRVANA